MEGRVKRKEKKKLSCDIGTGLQPITHYTSQLLKGIFKQK